MDNIETEKVIRETVADIIRMMGFESEISVERLSDDDSWVVNIKTEQSNFLIGQYGVNLQSLQHLSRVIIRKKTDQKVNFTLDVNSYRQEKTDSIVKMAESLARQALTERRAIVLRPMSPYERRIVHLELAKNDKIKTESIGEGDDRRVVIKPVDII